MVGYNLLISQRCLKINAADNGSKSLWQLMAVYGGSCRI